MGSIKRIVSTGVLMIIIGAGAILFRMPNALAASCTSGDGKATCSGECCLSTATTCTAGPCSKFVVNLD